MTGEKQMEQNSSALLVPILVVDDDEIDVQAITRAFNKHQIKNPFFVASDGLDALEKLRGSNGQPKLDPLPRVIMLDINMPRMNGIEFLKELRKDPLLHNLIVFMFTSSDHEEDIISTYNLNVSGYIKKPLDFSGMMQTIDILNKLWTQLQYPPTQ
jgi:CheY-like chemotaxis protein